MLQTGLGVIQQQSIMVAIIPTAKPLIRDGHTTGCAIGSSAHRGGDAFVMIVTVIKPAFTAQFEFNFTLRLTFFGDDVDQTAGTSPAIQRCCPGDNFNVCNIKRINGVKLTAVGAGRVETNTVNKHNDGATTHVHPVVGSSLTADINSGD